jgi:hypothetical protein
MAPAVLGGRSRPAREWLGAALALLFAAAPAIYWGGRVLDEEAVGFLRKNWGERGALQEIFDVRGYDFYQGRELSYALDYLDAQWLHLLASHDVLFFYPPSAVLASLSFVAIGLVLLPRALPRLGAATRWLGVLVLLSNFVCLTTLGLLYRATKPLVAPLLLGLLLLALAEQREPRLGRRAAFAASFLLSLGLSLLDRQGLFYVLTLALALAAWWAFSRRGLPLALGALAGAACWYAYFTAIAPPLIHGLEGYWPQTRFQRLRLERLLQPQLWRQAADVLGSWTSVLLGGLAPWLLALLAAAAAAAWAWHERRRPRRIALTAGLALAALAGQLTMVAMMVDHHPPVAWTSHRLWYYPFPFQAVALFLLLWALERLAAGRGGWPSRAVPLALATLVALNVACWPDRRSEFVADPMIADTLRRSELVLRSLQQGHAAPLLDGDHRRFYFEWLDQFPRFATRAQPQVGEGDGVLVSEVRSGRLLAWAGREAHLVARTNAAGRYRLAGRARLRSGDALQVLLGSPPRLLAEVRRSQPGEGVEAFSLVVELSAGANDVRLLSRLPETRVAGSSARRFAAYQLELPVALWPVAREETSRGPRGPDQNRAGLQLPRYALGCRRMWPSASRMSYCSLREFESFTAISSPSYSEQTPCAASAFCTSAT